jgi:hypothetical protein
MTQRTALLASLVGAATLWSTHADAAPPTPAWCKVDGAESLRGSDPKSAVKQTLPDRAVQGLVENLCAPDDEGVLMRKELEATRAIWSKKLDMTDADWTDAAAWVVAQNNRESSFTFSYDGRSLSSLDGFEQYFWMTRPFDGNYQHYFADALGTKLTELGRMGYVSDCLSSNTGPGAWAICHPDVVALDLKKVHAEIRAATKHTPAHRMAMWFAADELRAKIATRIKDVKALIDKDPAYGTMFAIAPPIHKDWASRAGSSLVQLVLAMDDGRISGSRKAFADCDEKTWTALSAAISALPAKTFDNVIEDPGVHWFPQIAVGRALADRDVYLAAAAYTMCADRDGKIDPLGSMFSQEMLWHPGFRGPRTESHNAILLAGIEPDNKNDRIELPSSHKPWFGKSGYWPDLTSGRGVVASVKKGDKTAVITFAKETAQQTVCDNWKTSNRISRIAPDGSIEYHGHCTKEHSETVRTEDGPQTVSLRSLTGVKKGTYIHVQAGIVTVVYPKKGAKNPVAVFGAAVK